MLETWRSIPGWEAYEVSDHGKVRSIDRSFSDKRGQSIRRSGKTLNTDECRGYLRVRLSRSGKKTAYAIHTLVLLAFEGPAPEGMECCHNDGDRTNNHLGNLRWGTRSENTIDQVKHGTHYESTRSRCPRGHLLESPNLAPWALRGNGHRTCLACARARAYCKKFDLMDRFKEYADRYFDEISMPVKSST